MTEFKTLIYQVEGRIARITLNRPERGNGITFEMPFELARAVEKADLNPNVHVIALSGNGTGFCGGYDLVNSAEGRIAEELTKPEHEGTALDPSVQSVNHNPDGNWDVMLDYAMMSRFAKAFMSLWNANKPVVCKVHGYCVAGGTDMALCSDLLIIEDKAKIGYPPARVWGSPTTALWAHRLGAQKAKRLLFTGDSLSGEEAVAWGMAIESAPIEKLNERFEILLERIARVSINQLMMMKLLVNQVDSSAGLHNSQLLGVLFDGVTRHSEEGYTFQKRAAEAGFRQAVKERDEPFGDYGLSTFKG